MNARKWVFLFLTGCLFVSIMPLSGVAQPAYSSQNSKWFTGGGLGLQLGTITFFDVSPHVGYFITEKIALGAGITYQYYSDKRFTPKFTADVIGGRLFGRYHIIEQAFLHAEYEYLNYESALVDPYGFFIKPKRIEISNYLIGGGYRQPIGGRSYFNLLVLWNLNESTYSLYENPIIRMGVDFGL